MKDENCPGTVFFPGGEPAAAYYRYSSHGQTEQSIEGQRSKAREYAIAHRYNIVQEYADRGMTGRNDDREEFQRMLSDVSKHKFKVIILWKVDRFGRNREEIAFNKYHCRKNGVRVEYVAESIPQSPEGVILESVLEGMAEYFSLQLSQNVRRGQLESARKAQSTGGNRPLGYLTGPDKKFVIDPDTAPTVQTIFAMYAQGYTVTEIVNHLNDKGLRTLRGKPFTKSSLRSILKNEKYIGVYAYKDIIRMEDAIPPIIDEDTFNRVQELLKINQRAPGRKWTKAEYILSGKLFCGHCGAQMVGESGTSSTGAKYNYYLCANHKRDHSCPKRAVKQEWIEKLVLDATIGLLRDDVFMEYIADKTWEFYQAQDESRIRVESYTAQLKTVTASIDNLVRAVESGFFIDIISKRLSELNEEKAQIEEAIAKEKVQRAVDLTRDHILYFLQQFRNRDYTDRDEQKRLVEIFVNAIFVYDDKITLTYNYGAENTTISLSDLPSDAFDYRAECCTKIPGFRKDSGDFAVYLLLFCGHVSSCRVSSDSISIIILAPRMKASLKRSSVTR